MISYSGAALVAKFLLVAYRWYGHEIPALQDTGGQKICIDVIYEL